jgi:hypothetical protein
MTKILVNLFAMRAGAWMPQSSSSSSSSSSSMSIISPLPPPQRDNGGFVFSNSRPAGASAAGLGPNNFPGARHQAANPSSGGAQQQYAASKMFRPPFRNAENVLVGIVTNDTFQLRKRLLGPQVSRIISVISQVPGGNQSNIKIRLRGIGATIIITYEYNH